MKEVYLANGKGVTLVDDIDYENVNRHKWYLHTGYAAHDVGGRDKRVTVFLHNALLGLSVPRQVDHIDRNRLNNQRNNLRIVTESVNKQNKSLSSNNTSGYRGVAWHSGGGKWMAYITHNYKRIHLGFFDAPEVAAITYNQKARELFGPNAATNFPLPALPNATSFNV